MDYAPRMLDDRLTFGFISMANMYAGETPLSLLETAVFSGEMQFMTLIRTYGGTPFRMDFRIERFFKVCTMPV